MTLLVALTAGSGVHWLSSTMGVIFAPNTPPLAFHSLMANKAPSLVDTPKVGTGPDRGARIAILISVAAAGAEVVVSTAAGAMVAEVAVSTAAGAVVATGAVAPPHAESTTANNTTILNNLNERILNSPPIGNNRLNGVFEPLDKGS